MAALPAPLVEDVLELQGDFARSVRGVGGECEGDGGGGVETGGVLVRELPGRLSANNTTYDACLRGRVYALTYDCFANHTNVHNAHTCQNVTPSDPNAAFLLRILLLSLHSHAPSGAE